MKLKLLKNLGSQIKTWLLGVNKRTAEFTYCSTMSHYLTDLKLAFNIVSHILHVERWKSYAANNSAHFLQGIWLPLYNGCLYWLWFFSLLTSNPVFILHLVSRINVAEIKRSLTISTTYVWNKPNVLQFLFEKFLKLKFHFFHLQPLYPWWIQLLQWQIRSKNVATNEVNNYRTCRDYHDKSLKITS